MDPQTSSPATPPAARHGWRIALTSLVVLVLAAGVFLGIYLPSHPHSTAAGTPSLADTGCPSASPAPANAPTANETIQETDVAHATQANVGDTISVDLPSSSKFYWTFQSAPISALQMLAPAGYYDASHQTCVWNFKATSAGQNQLAFMRQPTCKKGFICPPLEIIFRFALVVR